jgi:flagellar assembly protein FliH
MLLEKGLLTDMGALRQIEVFEYPAGPDSPLPAWAGWAPAEEARVAADGDEAAHGAAVARVRTELEQRLAEETRRSFEAGRERGRIEGRQSESESREATEAAREERQVRQLATLAGSFSVERDRYLQAVEQEVVKLALAVAARILRREAQMDPLLLTGAVRVALGQLAATTEVRLRVPETDLDLWTEAINLLPNLALKPAVVAGEGMRIGDCEIESGVGSVDLGIRAQLGEIERGFFDRIGGQRAGEALRNAVPQGEGREIHA